MSQREETRLNMQKAVEQTTQRKRAIIYCRVSDPKQEDGESLEFQEEKGKQYAEQQGYHVLLVLKEVQSGYVHYSLRPKLTLARQMIKDGAADVIIVWDLRRFSRNFVHSALIFDEIEQAGGCIESVYEKIDDSLTGKLIRSIMMWCAESERHKIVEYANRHWKSRYENGLPVGTGAKPYGWDWADETKTSYVLNIEEAAVRYSLFDMLLDENMSLRSIEKKLLEDGVKPPKNPRTRKYPRWHATTIRAMILDERNIGVLPVGKYKKVLRENGKKVAQLNPDVKRILGGIPSIVSVERYERAKAKLERNKREKSNKPENEEQFLLRGGFIFCKACRWRMMPKSVKLKNGKMDYKYRCSGTHQEFCLEPASIVAYGVDQVAWEECCKLFERAKQLQKVLQQAIDNAVGNIQGEEKLDEKIATLQREIERVYRDQRKHPEGSYLYNLIEKDLHQMNMEIQAWEQEKRQVQPIEFRANLYKEKVLGLINFLDTMQGQYQEATYQQKRDALEVLGVKVFVGRLEKSDGKRFHAERIEVQFSPRFAWIETKELRCVKHE